MRSIWCNLMKSWRALPVWFRTCVLFLVPVWLNLAVLPFIDTRWWFAPEHRLAKTQLDLALGGVQFCLLMLLLIAWGKALRRGQQAAKETRQ